MRRRPSWTAEPHGRTTGLYVTRHRFIHGLRLMNLDDGDMSFKQHCKLICAAPDLLAACKALAANPTDPVAQAQAAQAIAWAEGTNVPLTEEEELALDIEEYRAQFGGSYPFGHAPKVDPLPKGCEHDCTNDGPCLVVCRKKLL